MAISRITLRRNLGRYVITEREFLFESDVLLTPYSSEETIDEAKLGEFVAAQYEQAGVDAKDVDTGALILTGTALRPRNARRIGEVFAERAGRTVAVSAGDAFEAVLAAYGAGAVARSRDAVTMNVDVGGGTSKIAVCVDGAIRSVTALDVGARLVAFDDQRRIIKVERAAMGFASDAGVRLRVGGTLGADEAREIADCMADRLFEAMRGGSPTAAGTRLLRLDPLTYGGAVEALTFSGGVAEYIYDQETRIFGDLGPELARAIRTRSASGVAIEMPAHRLRATVLGAGQYQVQMSGGTIFVSPPEVLPLRDVPVVAPRFGLAEEEIDVQATASAVRTAIAPLDDAATLAAIAVYVPWRGTASYRRLDAFCRGLVQGLSSLIARRLPVILVGDGDVGGLLGIHLRDELGVSTDLVSIDGLSLDDFDYLDVGALLAGSGAVPVVIKSLIFPPA